VDTTGKITFDQASFQDVADSFFKSQLAARIFNTPLTVTPDRLQTIISAFGGHFGVSFEGMRADLIDLNRNPVGVDEEGSKIAIIRVYDTLVYKTFGLMTLSGLTSYEQIRAEFDAALADDKVEEIVFDIESPGGEVAGNFELVDHIYESRGIKPITAIVNDYAYSGGFSIATAADKIYLPRTGGVGSVGVIAVHVDQSSYDEKAGLKYTAITSGKKKNAFSPHKALSDDAIEELQERIDESRQIFVDTVARNRDLASKDVYDTEAGLYQGAKAIEVGFADEVLSWHEVIGTIIAKYEGGKIMSGDSTKASQTVDEPEVAVGSIAEMEAEIESLQAEVESLESELVDWQVKYDEVQQDLAETKKANRRMEIQAMVDEMHVIGSIDDAVDTLMSLEAINPEMFEKELDRMRQTSEALSKSKFFEEEGSSAEGQPSAYQEIMQKVKELVDQGISERDAHRQVMKSNPTLYAKYRNSKQ